MSEPPRIDWCDVDMAHCSVAATADIIGDRWSLLILRDVFAGVSRYGDLQRHIDMSTSVLAERLKRLVAAELLATVDYQDPSKRARREYRLTEQGRSLLFVVIALGQFGNDHLIDPDNHVVDYIDKETGRPVRLALVRDDGRVIDPSALRTHINEDAVASPNPSEDHR